MKTSNPNNVKTFPEAEWELRLYTRAGKLLLSLQAATIGDAAWVAMNLLGSQSEDDVIGYAQVLSYNVLQQSTQLP